MELITTGFMVTSFIVGALLGFITLITGDSRIKSLVDGGGAIILLLSLYAMMPSIEWGTPVNEAAHNLLNHFEAAIPALVSYMIGDACGSAGSALVS